MKSKVFRKPLICFLLFIVSCAVNPVTGKKELMLISEQQEIRLGKEAAPSLNWDFGGKYKDPELESYLNGIMVRIWKNSERPHLPFKFYIQNTSIPNAFALPGYIAITRGLLSELENEAQFAAVMGHEAGHVMARHTAQRLSRTTLQQIGLAVGGAFLEGKKGADTLLTLGAIGTSLFLLKYDRAQEIQSDRLGVKYMAKLGYDPYEAVVAHKILESSVANYLMRLGKSSSQDTFISNLLSTHPRSEVRLGEIREMINELPAYNITGDGKFGKRFQNNLKRIKELNKVYFIYDKAENYYNKGNFKAAEQKLKKAIMVNNGQAPFFNLLGFVELQKKNYMEAKRSFNNALSADSGYQPSIYGSGLVHYFQKDYDHAIREFNKSLGLYPDHAGTHFGMGKSYFFMSRYREAIPYLEKIAGTFFNNPEVHGLLGICYEKTLRIQEAIKEYRYQIKIAPESELGIYARKRLEALNHILKK